MTNCIDIVDLIVKNPIAKLSSDSQNKLIRKIEQKFTENQQNLFIASFYCYLNYDKTKDFVIDLRNIWSWLGFSRIEECKRVLVKHFTENIDYLVETDTSVNFAPPTCGAKESYVDVKPLPQLRERFYRSKTEDRTDKKF